METVKPLSTSEVRLQRAIAVGPVMSTNEVRLQQAIAVDTVKPLSTSEVRFQRAIFCCLSTDVNK